MKRVAVFIDGDNVSAGYGATIAAQADKHGRVDIIHVYGNTNTQSQWSDMLAARFIYAGEGKNGADLLLALDAMDLCEAGKFDTIVLASSDADFVHLAHRLRARGPNVIGMGMGHPSKAFQAACSQFEILTQEPVSKVLEPPKVAQVAQIQSEQSKIDNRIRIFIDAAMHDGTNVQTTTVSKHFKEKFGVTITSMGFKNWRQYFQKHSGWYELIDAPKSTANKGPIIRRRATPTAVSKESVANSQTAFAVAAE